MRGRAREKLVEAKDLVRQTEKPYEPHVPDRDEWEPPMYAGVVKKGEIVGTTAATTRSTACRAE